MEPYCKSASPGDAGGELADDCSQGGKHRPAAVLQLALTEPLDAEDLGVGSERACLKELIR